jgi:sirohydrochlorin ferrochelatase
MRAVTRIATHEREAQKTVVVVAHGTLDPAGVDVARWLVGALRSRLPSRPVLLAFVDVVGPTVCEVVAGAAGPVTVVPAFLTSGYHVRSDVTVTAALGPHPLLVRAMSDRLRLAGLRSGDAVVLAAAGSSDPGAVADVRAAACQLSGELGCRVRVGFIATGAPSVTALVAGLRVAGEPRVAVASWLLAPGQFHRKLALAGADVVAAPLGTHPGVIDRLADLAGACAVPAPRPPFGAELRSGPVS